VLVFGLAEAPVIAEKRAEKAERARQLITAPNIVRKAIHQLIKNDERFAVGLLGFAIALGLSVQRSEPSHDLGVRARVLRLLGELRGQSFAHFDGPPVGLFGGR
jgi:hypothetical protein